MLQRGTLTAEEGHVDSSHDDLLDPVWVKYARRTHRVDTSAAYESSLSAQDLNHRLQAQR